MTDLVRKHIYAWFSQISNQFGLILEPNSQTFKPMANPVRKTGLSEVQPWFKASLDVV